MGFRERRIRHMENQIDDRITQLDDLKAEIDRHAKEYVSKIAQYKREAEDIRDTAKERRAAGENTKYLKQRYDMKQESIASVEAALKLCQDIQTIWDSLIASIDIAYNQHKYKEVLSCVKSKGLAKLLSEFDIHELRNALHWIESTRKRLMELAHISEDVIDEHTKDIGKIIKKKEKKDEEEDSTWLDDENSKELPKPIKPNNVSTQQTNAANNN